MRTAYYFFSIVLTLALVCPNVRARPVGEDVWLGVLTALLTHHYQVQGELSLTWSRPPSAALPLEPRVELTSLPQALSPQILINALVTDPQGQVSRQTFILRAELWQEGYATREPGRLGEPVALSDLELVRFDAMRERGVVTLDPTLELDFQRAVGPGRLLTWNDVRRRPLVRRGQSVEVAAVDGHLFVTLRAIALHDAGRGQSVRVRNPDSRREFTALVTGEARAIVNF
jgi:flagellar basal body P-ring formation protein FlgA